MIRMSFLSVALIGLIASVPSLIAAQQEKSEPPPRPAVEEHKGPPPGAMGQFELSSSALTNGGELPNDLKCTRHGGDGLSPPLEWLGAPDNTGGFAIVMQHYPRGRFPGVDSPSHYWLVWDIPASTSRVERGNPDSFGNEGSDKDKRRTGYTPPCSPDDSVGKHTYTITVYAVDGPLEALPENDDPAIVWDDMMEALKGHVLNAASLSFTD
ncbi:YbhB/YbcL family Raf kinase inhibitor-like protein [Granulosicoccus sp.]|nr:YbhB/YbcL family Raf kinase inhibitor-like protein [Granulosicoccus sp.]